MPNAAHLHLLVNHLPVLGTVFSLILLLYGLLKKSEEIKKASFIGVILTGLGGAAAYFTGEPAEHMIGRLQGVSRQLLHTHQESANIAIIPLGLAALLALFFLIQYRQKVIPKLPLYLVGALLIIVSVMMYRTANEGGLIRHPEIDDATLQTLPVNPAPPRPPKTE